MAIESYVGDILKSPEATFRKILSKIIQTSDKDAKIELVRQYTQVDETLFEAIKSILTDLKLEESMFSQLLYSYFNIEIVKNKKRKQLIILGTQLKREYKRVEKEQNRVDIHIFNLSSSLDNLKRLKDAFKNKREFLYTKKERNKNNAFIKRLNAKIDELSIYEISLQQKYLKLRETERLYNNLYRQIPRYNELQEESLTNLLSPPKKQKRFSWN